MVKLHQVQLLPRVPIILKDLYDADLLEEDVIFAWAEKVGFSLKVIQAAQATASPVGSMNMCLMCLTLKSTFFAIRFLKSTSPRNLPKRSTPRLRLLSNG